ncbi:helix-turn-helix domain-containing protein [Streptomyces sp. NPDC087437]|uniref:helix-turn-helix domain-containing protein n=1 Tax=Streptomyces sp. NPDC087437 TaxID=3365789 RepID=UPI00382FC4B8
MSTARDNVARQSRDGAETSHETPVIPLRPGLTTPPKEPPTREVDVARRQAEALRLSREKLSLREIGERLGVSKDTARRDIRAALSDEVKAAEATSQETPRDGAETSQAPTGDTGETPAASDGGGRDTLVLVLDEPLRQALAVLRATRGRPDTPAVNAAVTRAAIRATAATVLEAQQNQGGPTP